MDNESPSNKDVVDHLGPWFQLFSRVAQQAMKDHLAAVEVLGLPRGTERANDLHRTQRNNFRELCDLAGDLLELREEPEGQGLDYLVSRLDPEQPLAIRWGRYKTDRIRRNRTGRSAAIQEQLTLWAPEDEEADGLPVVSIAHTIRNEFTQGGRPCWQLGELYLVRERKNYAETIIEIESFEVTEEPGLEGPPSAVKLMAQREEEVGEWDRLVSQLRGRSA